MKIFKKLITDPTTGNEMVGIWLVDSDSSSNGQRKELYINATYIATGILRSNNFNGELGTKTIIQKTEDLIVINPGSLTYPRQEGRRPSYVVLEVEKKDIKRLEIVYL